MDDYLFPTCAWCEKEIKQYPAYGVSNDGISHTFCDILCAKLYNDYSDKILFDFDSFTRDYYKTTSKYVKKLYERCKDLMFEELPIYTASETANHSEIKEQYERLFLRL